MSTEENKTLIRRLFEEGINQNNPNVFDELIAPDFVNYDAPPGTGRGPEGMRQRVANGKMVENWVQMDMLGLMQQLGVVPSMG